MLRGARTLTHPTDESCCAATSGPRSEQCTHHPATIMGHHGVSEGVPLSRLAVWPVAVVRRGSRWLSEGGDGLWRPLDGTSCEEHSAALIQVQAAQVEGTRQAAGGWRLLTAHRSILETRLAGAGGPTDPPDSTCVGRTQGVGRGQTGCGAVTSMGVGPGKGSAPAPQACLSSLMHGTDPGVESGGVCRPVVTTSRPGA